MFLEQKYSYKYSYMGNELQALQGFFCCNIDGAPALLILLIQLTITDATDLY